MDTYHYHHQLRALWEKSVALYKEGNRDPKSYAAAKDLDFLKAIGANTQDLYDFAEDYVAQGVPEWETFLSVQNVRLAYFRTVQKGVSSTTLMDPDSLPTFGTKLEGIDWLPRIIPKAKAKLRGELPPSLMYGCGGDRRFLMAHGISAAEFLQAVWQFEDSDQDIVSWLKRVSVSS